MILAPVMRGLDPRIHDEVPDRIGAHDKSAPNRGMDCAAWIAGSSPAMTNEWLFDIAAALGFIALYGAQAPHA
jgi:hypothetical protein